MGGWSCSADHLVRKYDSSPPDGEINDGANDESVDESDNVLVMFLQVLAQMFVGDGIQRPGPDIEPVYSEQQRDEQRRPSAARMRIAAPRIRRITMPHAPWSGGGA